MTNIFVTGDTFLKLELPLTRSTEEIHDCVRARVANENETNKIIM